MDVSKDKKDHSKELANALDDKEVKEIEVETPVVDDAMALKSTNDRLLSESKKYKERALAAEKQLKDAQEKKLTEQQEYQKLAEQYKTELETLRVKEHKRNITEKIGSAATKLGAIDLDAVLALGKKDLLQYDEATGEVFGVESYLDDLKKSKPYLFAQQVQNKINAVLPNGKADAKPLNAKDVAKMSKEQQAKVLAKFFR